MLSLRWPHYWSYATVTDDTTILDVFYRYFTPEVWNFLVVETNRYAAQCRGAQCPTPANRRRPWHDVTIEELTAYMGVCMLMGIVVLPRIDVLVAKAISQLLSQVMSLTRFEQISRYLHLCNIILSEQVPHGQPGYDPLFKLRKLLDMITPKLQSEYNPHDQMSIDEAMIPFKGRLGFKQYMKAKPTKWGIKVFVLADSVYRLQIYW